MPPLERSTSAFCQHLLFRSSPPTHILPAEHRNSVVEAHSGDGRSSADGNSLTQALLNSHPDEFRRATQAPFLRLAGLGKLDKRTLASWVSQDRLYAETYIGFISSLLARVNLPYAYVSDKSKSLRWRIVKMLTGALQNIHHEIDFFTSTADSHGLRLDHKPEEVGEDQPFMPEEATKQYIDLFRSFYNDTTLSLIEGMVVLWATEYCYLQAWTYASEFVNDASNTSARDDADGGACRGHFIPNWTSDAFVKFVDEIAELTDMLAERENANRKLEVYKAVWLHVLDIEQRFWPSVNEDLT